jgi:hypothetical protein
MRNEDKHSEAAITSHFHEPIFSPFLVAPAFGAQGWVSSVS